MTSGLIRQQYNSIPFELLSPGLLAGGGINRALNRFSIPMNQAWTLENWEPIAEGFTNRGIGWTKLNTTKIVTAKVQGCFVFNNQFCFIASGNLYTMPLAGGAVSLATGGSGIFTTTEKVRFAINQGSGVAKVYMCGSAGSSSPVFWDGSSVSTVANLLLISGYSAPVNVIVWRGRCVWSFASTSTNNKSRIVFSRVENGDNYNFAATSTVDAFDDYVNPGDNDFVQALGVIRIKNQSGQTEVLVACKSRQAYQADTLVLSGAVVEATFNRIGVDIECLNADSVISFLNDIWILGRTGVKGFTAVANQDGIAALVQSASLPIDPLILRANQSSAYPNTFISHFSNQRKIWIFCPKGSETSAVQNGITYPEVPNDYALCYTYGLTADNGTIVNDWYSRGGAGWAVSAACENGTQIIAGSYFGDIYSIGTGQAGTASDDYELVGATHRPIESIYETGDWIFDNFNMNKRLEMLEVRFLGDRQVKADFTICYDGRPDGVLFPNILSNAQAGGAGIWGSGLWGTATWAANYSQFMRLRPGGYGKSVRTKISVMSKISNDAGVTYSSNYMTIYGLAGRHQKAQGANQL